jgi:serine protease Do
MSIKNSVVISIFIVIILFLGTFVFYLYRNQLKLEHQWEQSQQKNLFVPLNQNNNHISENLISTAQLWRPVQDRIRDTVIQLFVQISAIDLLEPYKTPQQGTACGSGFFINDQAYIITNAHVINSAKSIWGQLPSLGKRIIDIEVVGISFERDLALLRVTEASREMITRELGGIPYLPLGDSDLVRRSDEVLAVGYPLGQQSFKSTNGIISGHEHHLIQMSAPINPGSSGGPLLNLKGETIGINSSGITESGVQNVGYAIPINTLKTILNDLYEIKILRKPFLGVRFNNSTESLTKFLGNPQPGGCYVIETIAGSPLEKAGVMRGDMIYEINGHTVDMFGDMSVPWSEDKISIIDYPLRLSIGDTVTLVAYRKGVKKTFSVSFSLSAPQAIRMIYPGYEPVNYEIFAGMVVQELTINHVRVLGDHAPGLRKYSELKYQSEPVLIISHVFPDSQLYRGRNMPLGATLQEINGTPIKTLADFRTVIKNSAAEEYLTLSASDNGTRAGEIIFVVLEMAKVIEEEPRLARDFRYQISEAAKEVLRTANAAKMVN